MRVRITVHLVSDAHLPRGYHHLTARAKAPLIALLSLASIALSGYVFSLLLELLRLLRDLFTVAPRGGVSLLRFLFGFGLPILAGIGWLASVVLSRLCLQPLRRAQPLAQAVGKRSSP